MGRLFGIRIERHGAMLFAGWWSSRVSWSQAGCFSNGSRWFSGWHRFPDADDFGPGPMYVSDEELWVIDSLISQSRLPMNPHALRSVSDFRKRVAQHRKDVSGARQNTGVKLKSGGSVR